jgi:pimeloyl-ACP methyl ester carboxylesterase
VTSTPPAIPASLIQMRPLRSGMIQGDGVRLAYACWGRAQQPTIVLVHGYPDSSEVWGPLIQYLAQDFHVVTYDVRGAGQSEAPATKEGYQLPHLMRDFKAVIDHVSPQRPVHLVAHDWGSVQSWESVTEPLLQGRIASFTTCSGPSLDHTGWWMRDRVQHRSLRRSWQLLKQGLKSWYIGLFHLPWVPEGLWRMVVGRTFHLTLKLLEGIDARPRADQVKDGINGLNLYRANIYQRLNNPRERHAHAPVQLLIPRRDLFVGLDLHEDLERWVPVLWRREFDAGHWMPLSHPRDMAGAIRRFVRFTERPVSASKAR